MTTALFDAGDFQRLDRERTLIEQRDRVPAQPDRSPIEDMYLPTQEGTSPSIQEDMPLSAQDESDEGSEYDSLLDSLLSALKRRL